MKISLVSVAAFVLVLAMAQVSAKSSHWNLPSSWSNTLENAEEAFQNAGKKMKKDFKAAGRSIRHGAKDTKEYLASVLGLSEPSASAADATAATASTSSPSVFVIPPAPTTSSAAPVSSVATPSSSAVATSSSSASSAPSSAAASVSSASAQPSSSTFQTVSNAVTSVQSSPKPFFAGKSRRCLIPVSSGSIASATAAGASNPNQVDSPSAAAATDIAAAPWNSYLHNKSGDRVTETLLSTVTATLVLPSGATINPMELASIREMDRFDSSSSVDPSSGKRRRIKDYFTGNLMGKNWWPSRPSRSKSPGLWDRMLGYGSSFKGDGPSFGDQSAMEKPDSSKSPGLWDRMLGYRSSFKGDGPSSSDQGAMEKPDSSKSMLARMMASFDSSKLSIGDRAKMFDFWHHFHGKGGASPTSTSDAKSSGQAAASTSTQELVFVTGTAQDGNPMIAGSSKQELPFCNRSKKL